MPNEEMSPLMSGPQAGNPAESPVNAGPLTPGGEDTPTKPTKEKVDKKEADRLLEQMMYAPTASDANRMLDKIENLIIQEKQFTSDASHELRTPISVILAQGEYLLDIAKDEKEKELAQTIVDKSKQISKLVSSLLLLARIDQHRQKFNKEKVDLFLKEYKASIEAVLADVDTAATLCEKHGIIAKAAIAKQAIPKCNLTFATGAEMKASLTGYFSVLYAAKPASIGGKMPADSLFYMGYEE